ncbi:hypothetical protein QL093DRAFT_2450969 [Fusarium oxysporum]|nr:hypothetical protein QL093DRAFT_2450969 [Fusarium oxysporum]
MAIYGCSYAWTFVQKLIMGGLLVWNLQKYLSVCPRRLKSFDDEGMSEVSWRVGCFGF